METQELTKKSKTLAKKISTKVQLPKVSEMVSSQEKLEPLGREAVVLSVSDQEVMLEINQQPAKAKIAFSCLVSPRVGDTVLYTITSTSIYILSILERLEDQTATLNFPEDTTLSTRKGSLNLVAQSSVSVVAGEQFNTLSQESLHQSQKATVHFENVTAKGSSLVSYFSNMNIVSKLVHSFSERFLQKSKSFIRQTEADDQVQAGQIIRKADHLYSVKSYVTVLQSEKDTFVDGEHVFTAL